MREAALDEAPEQVLHHPGILARPLHQPQRVLAARTVHANGCQNMVPVDHDTVEADDEQKAGKPDALGFIGKPPPLTFN